METCVQLLVPLQRTVHMHQPRLPATLLCSTSLMFIFPCPSTAPLCFSLTTPSTHLLKSEGKRMINLHSICTPVCIYATGHTCICVCVGSAARFAMEDSAYCNSCCRCPHKHTIDNKETPNYLYQRPALPPHQPFLLPSLSLSQYSLHPSLPMTYPQWLTLPSFPSLFLYHM